MRYFQVSHDHCTWKPACANKVHGFYLLVDKKFLINLWEANMKKVEEKKKQIYFWLNFKSLQQKQTMDSTHKYMNIGEFTGFFCLMSWPPSMKFWIESKKDTQTNEKQGSRPFISTSPKKSFHSTSLPQ